MITRAKEALKKTSRLSETVLGFSPIGLKRFANLPRFLRDVREYRNQDKSGQFPLRFDQLYPILSDFYEAAGATRGHYFMQDLWVARQIYKARPAEHVDIGSRIDGFIAHVLSFMPLTMIDIRPLPVRIEGLNFVQAESATIAEHFPNGALSVSSLHAVEHFGLGRYGDPVDPEGWRKGVETLKGLVAPGGTLYFSAPVGRERVEFNAHRVFSPDTILAAFAPLQLAAFAAIGDDGEFSEGGDPRALREAAYACGIFVFKRAH
ncbi:MAG: DUF268 domain-containing protein [Myxococcales bacterium]|nr:DUF268 domain-containing protein [Myxococcales bacterium]